MTDALGILTLIGNLLYILACILIVISLFIIFYPLITGKICSWNPPCKLEKGYDCKTCTHKSTTGIIDTILELLTFGAYRK